MVSAEEIWDMIDKTNYPLELILEGYYYTASWPSVVIDFTSDKYQELVLEPHFKLIFN